ncbi:MAG TPA: hypothetical protein VLL54_00645 [Pyrinomonadaceae bacterium]|nr:hypothetical protein [Pyrinomonadaceae bacterium]
MTSIPFRSSFRFFAWLIVCLLFVGAIAAQSGRRATQQSTVPAPTPEPTPTPVKPVEKVKPLTFIVGLDRDSFATNLSIYSGILRSCAQRLDEPATTKGEAADRDMSRSEALRRAKAETEDYVVWLRVGPDRNEVATANDNDAYIEYVVLAPITGKQVTSGHTYPSTYRRSTVILNPSGINGDRYYNEAAKAAADRILDHFHIGMIRP